MVKYCSNCGHVVSHDDKFCENCGSKIENNETSNKTVNNKGTNEVVTNADTIDSDYLISILIIGGIYTVIALLIGVIFLALTMGTINGNLIWGYDSGLTWWSFIVGVFVMSCLIGISEENLIYKVSCGFITGLFTSILCMPVVSLLWGETMSSALSLLWGNQTFILIIVGVITSVVVSMLFSDNK
ncbi:zinc ribbon domain-containing protein [Methanobrevibacter millerae]|uniref:Zinc-ribbon domain-containing protein n=1 Tax=Methanobrevibacter millerae TaxID=230361 RepID=A0A1G5UTT3_9EURY|nr:zinc ribbon domain-containing protein [Methanobrevibacter millerae]SDA37044.1 zinc-ribbon domain-containing protein [Methanobrevibacter millerae]